MSLQKPLSEKVHNREQKRHIRKNHTKFLKTPGWPGVPGPACLKGAFAKGCFLAFNVLRLEAPFVLSRFLGGVILSSTRITHTDS